MDNYFKFLLNLIKKKNNVKEPIGEMRKAVLDKNFPLPPPSRSVKGRAGKIQNLKEEMQNTFIASPPHIKWVTWNPPVYELVDTTNEDCYYPLGLWHSLEDLVGELNKCKTPYDLKSVGKKDYNDYVKVEVLYREGGWEGEGRKSVYAREWYKRLNKHENKEVWECKIEPIPTRNCWVNWIKK